MNRHVLTILAVDELERAAGFYERAFGWSRAVETPVYVELAADGGQRLGLYLRESFAKNTGVAPMPRPAAGTSATELYLHCDDLESAISTLRVNGARELSALATRAWGDDAAYFADPDGNVVVVARPRS